MKRSIIIAAAVIASTCSLAQKVNFKLVEDDPAFNNVTIAPFTGVNYTWGQTFSMNIGMEAWVRVLPVHLHGYIDQTYLSAAVFTANTSAPRIIEANAALPFGKKTNQKMSRTVLRSSSTKTAYTETINTTSIQTPATVLKMKTLRAGFYSNKGSYNQDVTFEGAVTPTAVKADYRSIGLFGGISTSWQRNTVYDVEGWGKRRNLGWTELYADVLVGVMHNYGSTDPSSAGGSRPILESEIESRRIGARIGMYGQMNNYSSRRPNSWGYRMEFGRRPGPVNEKWWLNAQAIYYFNW